MDKITWHAFGAAGFASLLVHPAAIAHSTGPRVEQVL
jgi:hypothetical protein